MTAYEKILGNLLGGAIGDAMGGPTEERSTDMIIEKFGGYVTDFVDAPLDTWAHGAKAGMVTDDFSLAYFTAQAMVENHGIATEAVAKKALLKWCEYPEYYDINVGPTTRAAINEMKGIPKPKMSESAIQVVCQNSKASNGAAMKIGPVGLFSNGDIDYAIQQAVTVCLPTHPNDISISGACAVAAAVSKGMTDSSSLLDLIDAAVYGAREGMRIGGEKGCRLAGPSVEKRICLAAELGLRANGDWEKGMIEIRDIIGNGLMTVEAVPAAIGLVIAARGDVLKSIYGGVNIGCDTDTIATIAGAIAGTYAGYCDVPSSYIGKIDSMNHFDLENLAKSIVACLK